MAKKDDSVADEIVNLCSKAQKRMDDRGYPPIKRKPDRRPKGWR